MSTLSQGVVAPPIDYPSSDGKPMSENTLQFEWIVRIQGSLDAQFAGDPNVFVAGDLLWYPVQGNPRVRAAPDAMVVIGRPKGHRSSYLQWQEGGIAPQVTFEIRSPGNTNQEMQEKLAFYETHGVMEYYFYDPDHNVLEGWQRSGPQLRPIANLQGWVSPRLGIRFVLSATDLVIRHPDGRPFLTPCEAILQRQQAEDAAGKAADDARKAEDAAREAIEARDRLAAKLRALGVDPDA